MTINFNGTTGVTFPDSSVQNTAATGFGFKNRFINGAMDFAQRGTSFSTPATGAYTLDRWAVAWSGAAPATVAQVAGPTGFRNAIRLTGAASNTSAFIFQRIESYNCSDLSGATITIQANIAVSTAQTILWVLYCPTAQDNYTSVTTIASGTWSATSTATTFTATISGLPANAVNGLQIGFYANNNGAFTSGTITITGVQLEKSPTATAFDYRPYGTELALCQRYTWVVNSAAASGATIALGLAYNGVSNSCPLQYPVPMRASPTITFSSGTDFGATNGGGVNIASTSMSVFGTNSSALEIQATVASGFTTGQASILRSANVNARIYIAAEL